MGRCWKLRLLFKQQVEGAVRICFEYGYNAIDLVQPNSDDDEVIGIGGF